MEKVFGFVRLRDVATWRSIVATTDVVPSNGCAACVVVSTAAARPRSRLTAKNYHLFFFSLSVVLRYLYIEKMRYHSKRIRSPYPVATVEIEFKNHVEELIMFVAPARGREIGSQRSRK